MLSCGQSRLQGYQRPEGLKEPEGSGMGKTKKSGIARKLEEFGFLWALYFEDFGGSWKGIRITVDTATEAVFDRDQEDTVIWLYGTNATGPVFVYCLQILEDSKLGFRALRNAEGMTNVQYVVSHRSHRLTIYRAPKGMGFREFLQRYSLNSTQPSSVNRC